MSGKWFANRGQVVQVILTAIALVVAVIVSLPALKQHSEFLDFLPFAFFLLAIYGAFRLGKLFPTSTGGSPASPAESTTTPSASQHPFKTFIDVRSPVIRMGDFWEEKLQFRTVRITLIKIIDGQKPIAELRFEGSGFHALPDLTSEDYRTFRLPAERSAARSEETSVFSFGFSESNIDMFAVRVDHINPHANEVRLTICNFRAVDLAKSF